MSKPTVFFSHSSKDRDLILPIKNKIEELTGGAVEIFMSSDGQSIPHGNNWVKALEDALNASELMFVFVTESSVYSSWLYFESGFAYSKGKRVIPVGIGIDVGTVSPLNILQGYNITSEYSLNNLIDSINNAFNYHFDGSFDSSDYAEIEKKLSHEDIDTKDFEKTISAVSCNIFSAFEMDDGSWEKYNFKKYFCDIVEYLDKNGVQYASDIEDESDEQIIVANGVKIRYIPNIDEDVTGVYDKIEFNISCYNFEKSFTLFRELLQLIDYRINTYLSLSVSGALKVITKDIDCSSIVLSQPEFAVDKERIGYYLCKSLGLIFRCTNNHELFISFTKSDVCAANIVRLVTKLRDIGLIITE